MYFNKLEQISLKWAKFICLVVIIAPFTVKAQTLMAIYPDTVPNTRKGHVKLPEKLNPGLIYSVASPELEMFLPPAGKSSGSAVIICPGGSYKVLVYQGEGVKAARAFAENGVTAFVLKYRLPDDSVMVDKTIGPLQDAQQAIKFVRQNAKSWAIDPNRIGVMGFSAGGHLAATLATHFKKPLINNPEKISLRPDFLILIYPVISMQDSLTHHDSKHNLLGKAPSKTTIDAYSNELQVDDDTPPAYITHAGDDKLVSVDNSIIFYEQLHHHKVPAELHLFPKGGHGFVLGQPIETWTAPIFKWMQALNK
jgi:acetyl esterase/lipase